MDFITQSLTGAVWAHAVAGRSLGRAAVPVGLVGGVLADADVFLRPLADPALPHELHRHFTHALLFIPVGAVIAAAPFMLARSLRSRWRQVGLAALVAYATHGLLDNCTSYGTHLLWPLLPGRTALDCMSIVDPIYTLTLVAGLVVALARGRPVASRIALALSLAYIGFGVLQHERAGEGRRRLAAIRGHEPVRARVMPTLGNLVVWRSLYEHEGRLYADAIRVGPAGPVTVRAGTSTPRFTAADLPPAGTDPLRVRAVFAGFDAFTGGFTAELPVSRPGRRVLGDMRISMETAGFAPIWGLAVEPGADDPVRAVGLVGDGRRGLGELWRDVIVPGEAFARSPPPSRRSPAAASR